jgi:predicted RNase H-like HicB family nuclease
MKRSEEGMAVQRSFTAVFERDGDWWVGSVEEMPGANTQGKTIDEARENLKEAIALVVEANRELIARQQKAKLEVIKEELAVDL